MAIYGVNEMNVADILHKGMLENIRKNTKTLLMNTLEKEVDTIIEQTLNQLKGYVEYHMDHLQGNPTFNIMINNMPFKETK